MRQTGSGSNLKIFEECFMCSSEFQMGPHAYHGTHIAAYKITVCEACFKTSWDGWAPHEFREGKLIEHLRVNGIAIPERNSKGLLPRGR